MGQSFSVNLAKVKSNNPVGYRVIRKRRLNLKKSIPRVRNTTTKRYTLRRQISKIE